MDVAEIANEPETELARWTAEEFIELLSEGFIRDRRIELIDGLMVKEMPQGPLHYFILSALSRAFAALETYSQGLIPTPAVSLRGTSVVEPEFALFRPEALGQFGIPGEDVILWVVEVSVTSRRKDLTDKRDAYARANIPLLGVRRRPAWDLAFLGAHGRRVRPGGVRAGRRERHAPDPRRNARHRLGLPPALI